MSDIGSKAMYQGQAVTIIDDLVYLPLMRQIEWYTSEGDKRTKWVKRWELEITEKA